MLHCVAGWYVALHCVAINFPLAISFAACSVLLFVAVCCSVLHGSAVRCSVVQCVAVCGSVLQGGAVRCSVSSQLYQWDAVFVLPGRDSQIKQLLSMFSLIIVVLSSSSEKACNHYKWNSLVLAS